MRNDSTVNNDNNEDILLSSDEDDYDFKKSKMPRLDDEAESKVSNQQQNMDEKDEEFCSICLDHWTNAGAHRLVCLKCGHLFGER